MLINLVSNSQLTVEANGFVSAFYRNNFTKR